jgi:hypothetical protein
MTLKSKYFQANSLINQLSLATKSTIAMWKTDLHSMHGNSHLKKWGQQTELDQQLLIFNAYPGLAPWRQYFFRPSSSLFKFSLILYKTYI